MTEGPFHNEEMDCAKVSNKTLSEEDVNPVPTELPELPSLAESMKNAATNWMFKFIDDDPEDYLDEDKDGFNMAVANIVALQSQAASTMVQLSIAIEKGMREQEAFEVMKQGQAGSDYSNLLQ